ncbi:MAG: efflux RND transporter periplasmic adaptor subunit [Anaerolineales bacterium]
MAGTQNKKKKRLTWLWLILAVIVVGGLIVGWRIWQNRQNTNEALANIETEPYQRMTLNASIFGTGTVQPEQTAVLSWSTSGIVGDVNVAVGQSVSEDDLLMELDPDSLSVDILQAQIELINAQNALDDLYNNWEAQLAQAKLDLLMAEEDLDDLATDRKIMNYQRCTDERIEELEDDLDAAEKLYDFFQTTDNLRIVNTAQANLDYCLADFTEQEVAEAELRVELGEARVATLQAQVDQLADGPDPDQVAIYETQVAIAQSRLDSPMIKAPFDGVVTFLYAIHGDVVQVGQQAVQIDKLDTLVLDVQISEIDIPFVKVGQPAELVFDAYFESTFAGEVTEISPVGKTIQGVVEYSVRIKILDADEQIKPGMTAAVSIIFSEQKDVLVVPNDAIVSIDGQDHVYVKRNGGYEAVSVILGNYSDYYSEVLEADIQEGELIALNPPDEITGQGFGSFRGGPPDGFGPFGD